MQPWSTQLPYVSLRSQAQAYVPSNYYRCSLNGYVSLTGFLSLPLSRQGRIRSQSSEIHFDTSPEAFQLHDRWVLRRSSFNDVIDGRRADSDDPTATETWHSRCRQFLRVPRNESKTRLTRYIAWDQRRRFPTDSCNQSPIGGGDVIAITLPLNASIHQQRAINKVQDDIRVHTATSHDETLTKRPGGYTRLSREDCTGIPDGASTAKTILPAIRSLPAMSAYESDERSLL